MALHKVRTTIRPLDELEVDDRELADLTAQGLLLDTKATTEDGILKAAEQQASIPTDEQKDVK